MRTARILRRVQETWGDLLSLKLQWKTISQRWCEKLLNRCLQYAQVPDWMTKGKTTLIQMDTSKGTALNNYRPITCLPMMWKILTVQIREEIYNSLTNRGMFPDEQKGCCKWSKGTAELLYIDQHIMKKKEQTEKSSYGLDRQRKGIWYGSAKLVNKLSQNV